MLEAMGSCGRYLIRGGPRLVRSQGLCGSCMEERFQGCRHRGTSEEVGPEVRGLVRGDSVGWTEKDSFERRVAGGILELDTGWGWVQAWETGHGAGLCSPRWGITQGHWPSTLILPHLSHALGDPSWTDPLVCLPRSSNTGIWKESPVSH